MGKYDDDLHEKVIEKLHKLIDEAEAKAGTLIYDPNKKSSKVICTQVCRIKGKVTRKHGDLKLCNDPACYSCSTYKINHHIDDDVEYEEDYNEDEHLDF